MRVKVKARVKGGERAAERIPIITEFIKLDAFLKFANVAESGGMAKSLIEEGLVAVNGETCSQRGKKLRPGDRVAVEGQVFEVTAEESCTSTPLS